MYVCVCTAEGRILFRINHDADIPLMGPLRNKFADLFREVPRGCCFASLFLSSAQCAVSCPMADLEQIRSAGLHLAENLASTTAASTGSPPRPSGSATLQLRSWKPLRLRGGVNGERMASYLGRRRASKPFR